jgi:hypothetical protein
VREDLGNHRGIFDRGDDLQAAPTMWAVLDIDVEDPLLAQARLSLIRAGERGA